MLLRGAEPFFYRGGPTGALLVHGFTGAPREMRPLGEALAAAGHTVLGVRLAHHGTQPADMFRSHWRDWAASALDGFCLLRGQCSSVFIMGLSMGGVLALYLAAHQPVSGVVALSTPSQPLLDAMDWRSRIAGPLSFIRPFAEKGPPDPEADPDHVHYPRYPVRAVPQLRALLRLTASLLPAVRAPALIIHSRADHSVAPANAEYLHGRLGSAHKQLAWLARSGHVITEGPERQAVFDHVLTFLQVHSAALVPAA